MALGHTIPLNSDSCPRQDSTCRTAWSKELPQAFSDDPDRLARSEREAEVLTCAYTPPRLAGGVTPFSRR